MNSDTISCGLGRTRSAPKMLLGMIMMGKSKALIGYIFKNNRVEVERISRNFFLKNREIKKGVFIKILKTPYKLNFTGAGVRSRTADFLITSEILYQLSYAGTVENNLYQGAPGNSSALIPQ